MDVCLVFQLMPRLHLGSDLFAMQRMALVLGCLLLKWIGSTEHLCLKEGVLASLQQAGLNKPNNANVHAGMKARQN